MPPLLLVQEAAHAGGEEGFTPFSINTGLIFWTIVVFGILLVLLWKLGLPALLKSVEERDRARAEAVRLLEEHKRAIAGARAEAQELIAQARTVAEKERAALLAQA